MSNCDLSAIGRAILEMPCIAEEDRSIVSVKVATMVTPGGNYVTAWHVLIQKWWDGGEKPNLQTYGPFHSAEEALRAAGLMKP